MKTAVIYAGSMAANHRAARRLHPSYQSLERRNASVASLAEAAVARWGRSSASPFLVGADRTMIRLGAGAAGYVRQGRWAVFATDVAAPAGAGAGADALDELLDVLARDRLRPVFACVTDAEPYRDRGMHAIAIADDAVIDLGSFTLSGARRAGVRHSVNAARRAGIVVAPFCADFADGAVAVSAAWLATKRGGEMGFTLGRFDPDLLGRADCRVAVDAEGRVVGLVSWHRYDAGRARVLDLMRRAPDAPNATMDALIAESLLGFSVAESDRLPAHLDVELVRREEARSGVARLRAEDQGPRGREDLPHHLAAPLQGQVRAGLGAALAGRSLPSPASGRTVGGDPQLLPRRAGRRAASQLSERRRSIGRIASD